MTKSERSRAATSLNSFRANKSVILGRLSGIRSESVNYIGYYSAHEETMKAVIAEQAIAGEERVAGVVRGATVDCRSYLLQFLDDVFPMQI